MADPVKIGKYDIQSVLGKGRHGGRLQGLRSRDRACRRDQDRAQGPGRPGPGRTVDGTVQERGGRGGPTAASQYRQRVRIWRGRRQRVHRHGIRRGHRHAGVPEPRRQFRSRPDQRHDDAVAAGAGFRARARRRPSRHQAGEPDPDEGRRAQGRGFRHRAHRHVEPDDDGHGDGHAVVHVARAMPGSDGRPSFRPVQRRRRALRIADRRQALRGCARNDRLQDLPRESAATVDDFAPLAVADDRRRASRPRSKRTRKTASRMRARSTARCGRPATRSLRTMPSGPPRSISRPSGWIRRPSRRRGTKPCCARSRSSSRTTSAQWPR